MTHKPPYRPRTSGDGWVEGADGARFWGLYGAAGLLAHDPQRGVLLQHRATWSHFGGTWGLPGGARHEGESAYDAATREAAEEAAVPGDALVPLFEETLDLGFWSYTTVAVTVTRAFEPRIADPESLDLRWVRLDAVESLPLHPLFAEAWPALMRRL
ncbi:NUDIX domain-containing protein [Salinibacterium sp. dk2585]|uniref:NUDIX domain-containing protein n=1 Tax=unclassified Salinibacterium TaxID=2632331 RepID=UPI0011C246BE|nr:MULTISPECIES: NUDIX domain-containing protein [unclassified Salinibacterium]QEE60992.1 NUDIX domain-containing protein [Salinibacterium sp. dk2585]TXK52934.1 NUDIX domain-containing protein [Salinibacterium sp. dk5596]